MEVLPKELLGLIEKTELELIAESKNKRSKGVSPIIRESADKATYLASCYQQKEMIKVAIILYAFSKIIGREESQNWKSSVQMVLVYMQRLKALMKSNQDQPIIELNTETIKRITGVDKRIQGFIDDVITRAKIKNSTNLFDQGVSLQQAATMTGTSQWELMRYMGSKTVEQPVEGSVSVIERIKLARKIFGVTK